MKRLSLLIVLSIFFFIFSCKKSEYDSLSSFKALKDGAEWIATSNYSYLHKTDNSISIYGRKKNSKNYEEEGLYLSFYISDISELNTITKFSSSWNKTIGGDLLTDSYVIDSISANFIQITSLDTINRQISGIFEVKLLKDKRFSNAGEIMNFTSGQFNLNYQEEFLYNSKSK